MSLPGFSGQNSLYISNRSYFNSGNFSHANTGVMPQATNSKWCTFGPSGVWCLDRDEVAAYLGVLGAVTGVEVVEGTGGGGGGWDFVGGIIGAIIGWIIGWFGGPD